MYAFRQKVEELKRSEATVYTICLALTDNETAACEAAEQALTALFQDHVFWQLDEGARKPHILKVCAGICLERRARHLQSVSSVV
ncbi:MAG: hypothetical protein K0Q63_347 [Paenibacillus sp.]|nr:hypothetical protein [Paenibacillus sp.]